MGTATTTGPLTVARLARALTYLVYAFVVVAMFRGLFEAVPLDGRSGVDVSVLFAMIVYALAALFLQALIDWLTDRIAEVSYAG